MRLSERTVTDLLAAFRSPDPTPGGGSASALAGAVGASLLAMVAALPKTRASGPGEEETLRGAGRHCASLSDDLTLLIDRDSEAYDLVMAAYRQPKRTDDEKTARSGAIQSALRSAIAAPLEVMRACAEAVRTAMVIGEFGNPSAGTDVQVALELLTAGLHGARANVEINLETVKDAAYVEMVREEIARLDRALTEDAEKARTALGRR